MKNRKILSLLWKMKEIKLRLGGEKNYNIQWGEVREKFYMKYGPITCPLKDIERLKTLHNKYKGNRIFIIGNGPSLNRTPLEKLEKEFTFGLNRIYLLFDRISWRPTFFTTVDWRVAPDCANEINALTGMGITFFFPERFRGILREGEDVYWYWQCAARDPAEKIFAYDASKGTRGGGCVTGSAIQIAYYMGFDPIYLIGVDASYNIPDTVKQSGPDKFGHGVKLYMESTQDDDPNHFDSRYFGKGRRWHDPNVPRMIQGYEQCKKGIEGQGRHIYNATNGGKLEVFERVEFNSLF